MYLTTYIWGVSPIYSPLWGALLHSYVQVSPEMFDRIQVWPLAGLFKDIQRIFRKPPLRCLGCVLMVVVLLEGEPSPQSEVLTSLSAAQKHPHSFMLLFFKAIVE